MMTATPAREFRFQPGEHVIHLLDFGERRLLEIVHPVREAVRVADREYTPAGVVQAEIEADDLPNGLHFKICHRNGGGLLTQVSTPGARPTIGV